MLSLCYHYVIIFCYHCYHYVINLVSIIITLGYTLRTVFGLFEVVLRTARFEVVLRSF